MTAHEKEAYQLGKKLYKEKKKCPVPCFINQWQENWIKKEAEVINAQYKGFVDAWEEDNKSKLSFYQKLKDKLSKFYCNMVKS